MKAEEMTDMAVLEGLGASIGTLALLGVVLRELRIARLEIKGLKHEVEKFLRPRVNFYVGNILQRRIKMKDTEKVTATIEVDDAKGFPTGGSPDQPPVWSIDDDTIASLAPSVDGLSCDIAGLKPGNANVSVALVVGGVSFVGSVPVPVVAGDAAAVKISLGTPVAQ